MITQETLSKEADELEDLLISMSDFDRSHVLLDEYTIRVWALKSINDIYPYDQAIRITDICDVLEDKLPRVSDNVFEQYVIYLNLLAICLKNIKGE